MFKYSVQKALFLCIAIGALVGCSKIHARTDNLTKANLSQLLITSQDLPSGLSQYGSPGLSSDDRTPDSLVISFLLFPSADSGIAQDYGIIQTIFHFKSVSESEANYNDLAPVYFGDVPSDWGYKNQYSDSNYISCYTYSNNAYPSCVWAGRYEILVIKVVANLYPGRLTLSDLENIISKIDMKTGKIILGK